MTDKVKEKRNMFFRFGDVVISFIVGLSAFFIIKLAFMIPLNLLTTSANVTTIEGIGALLILFSIYLSVKYTRSLNKNKSGKSRIIRRVMTIIIGFICMVITTAAITMSKNILNARKSTVTHQIKEKPDSSVFVVTRVNSDYEFKEEDFTEESLKSVEKWLREKTIINLKDEYEKNGFDFSTFDKKSIKSNSSYIIINKVKLAIVRIYSGNDINTVVIKGVKNKRLYTIACIRKDSFEVNYLGGKCGREIENIFGITLLGAFK